MSPGSGFVFSALFVMAVTPLLIYVANLTGALAPVDFRRRSAQRTALLGGVGVILSFVLFAGFFASLAKWQLIVPAIFILAFGAADDRWHLSSRVKFICQILTAGLWAYLLPIENLTLVQLGISSELALGLSVFWLIGMMNAVNMIDGMDSLASGFAFFAGLGLVSIFGDYSRLELLVVSGACLGFIVWNKPKAKIYLGDSGSQFLGFTLAAIALTAPATFQSYRSLLLPMLILSLPQMDAVLSMYRRFRLRSRMDKADHDHLHHKLQKLGLTVPQAWLVMMGAVVYSSASAFVLSEMLDSMRFWMVFVLCLVSLCTLLGAVLYLEWKLAHQTSQWSGTLLTRHLNHRLSPFMEVPKATDQVVVYDLFQYYKEIQHRGITELHSFVEGFAEFLTRSYPRGRFTTVGAYSVAVHLPNAKIQTNLITQDYFHFLVRHKLQVTENNVPWGLYVYCSEKELEHFCQQHQFSLESEKIQSSQRRSA